LAPGYYARQDTKTPVKIGIQAMAVNMVLNLALVGPLQHTGLALATSLAAFFNAYMLYRGLKATGHYKAQPGWPAFAAKAVVANVALFAVIYFMMGDAQQWLEWGTWQRIGWMSAIVGAGVSTYLVTLVIFGLRPRHLRGARF
jgi:putative peptidoglycan lipid II flippase